MCSPCICVSNKKKNQIYDKFIILRNITMGKSQWDTCISNNVKRLFLARLYESYKRQWIISKKITQLFYSIRVQPGLYNGRRIQLNSVLYQEDYSSTRIPGNSKVSAIGGAQLVNQEVSPYRQGMYFNDPNINIVIWYIDIHTEFC